MPKKKLRDGPVIDVDPQIILWRKKFKQLGACKDTRISKARAKKYNKLTSAERELADIMKTRS